MIRYPVTEYFTSINGEGPFAGFPAAFIRLRGCNLHCSYCDTRWSNTPDCPVTWLSGDELLEKAINDGLSRVTLTGGEPLLTENISHLINLFGERGFLVEIETNGSIPIESFCRLTYRPFFTMDYKCPGSGMEDHMFTDNFHYLQSRDSVKFVVSDTRDLDTAFRVISHYRLDRLCNVFLSPVFDRIDPKDIVTYMLTHHLAGVRLQLQLHKYIWPPEMRGV